LSDEQDGLFCKVFASSPLSCFTARRGVNYQDDEKTVLIGRRLLSTREEKVQKRGKEGMEKGGEETRMRPD
jgi:hypothetical protein